MPKEIDCLSGPNLTIRRSWGTLDTKKFTRGYAEKNGAARLHPDRYENSPVRTYTPEEIEAYLKERGP